MKNTLLAIALSISSCAVPSYALYLPMESVTKEQNHSYCKEKAYLVFKFYTLLEQGYDAYALSQLPPAKLNKKEWAIARTWWQGKICSKKETTDWYYESCMLLRNGWLQV